MLANAIVTKLILLLFILSVWKVVKEVLGFVDCYRKNTTYKRKTMDKWLIALSFSYLLTTLITGFTIR